MKASGSSITEELQNIRLLIQMQNSTQQDLGESQGMTGICNDPASAPIQVKWRRSPPWNMGDANAINPVGKRPDSAFLRCRFSAL